MRVCQSGREQPQPDGGERDGERNGVAKALEQTATLAGFIAQAQSEKAKANRSAQGQNTECVKKDNHTEIAKQ